MFALKYARDISMKLIWVLVADSGLQSGPHSPSMRVMARLSTVPNDSIGGAGAKDESPFVSQAFICRTTNRDL